MTSSMIALSAAGLAVLLLIGVALFSFVTLKYINAERAHALKIHAIEMGNSAARLPIGDPHIASFHFAQDQALLASKEITHKPLIFR